MIDELQNIIARNRGIGILKAFGHLEKGRKSMPIGTITNGRKKVAEGKWMIIKKGDKEARDEFGDKFEKLGYNVAKSNSEKRFGDSYYLYVYKDIGNQAKIRLSDHSVSNPDRMFGEIHASSNTSFNSLLKQVRFKTERSKFFKKVESFKVIYDHKESYKVRSSEKIIGIAFTAPNGKVKYKIKRPYLYKETYYEYLPDKSRYDIRLNKTDSSMKEHRQVNDGHHLTKDEIEDKMN